MYIISINWKLIDCFISKQRLENHGGSTTANGSSEETSWTNRGNKHQ